jgi:TonB family protein
MKMLLMTLACIPVAFAQSAEKPSVAADVAAPALLHRIEPEYTAEARSKGLEGVTALYAEVTRDGSVTNVRVTKSLDPGLDAKAVDAVKQWRFRPGTRNGKAVTVAATIEIDFRLPRYPLLPSGAPQPPLPLPADDWQSILQLLQMASVQ